MEKIELLSIDKSMKYLLENGFGISRKTFQKFLDCKEINSVDLSLKGADRRRIKISKQELDKYLIKLNKI
jgi:hypothetical protein